MDIENFGQRIRQLRMTQQITLREFARRLDVSPTYISQIEQGNFKPPAEHVVVEMARILRLDADELLALAGRVADDLAPIIRDKPRALAAFLRSAKQLTSEEIFKFQQQAKSITDERSNQCATH